MVWQNQVIIGCGQPKLLLKPGDFFRKAIGLAGQAAIALPLGQVISFDEAGIDGVTDR